jgi:alkyl sulfatase BDS1-like metallo-beta-lactamase superfamily hydrolase
MAATGTIALEGDSTALTTLAGLMDDFEANFDVVGP